MKGYKRTLFMGIIIIALGVVFSTAMSGAVGSLGTVFIAIGGFLFIVAMRRKRKVDQEESGS